MKLVQSNGTPGKKAPGEVPEEVTQADRDLFFAAVSQALSPAQKKRITEPERSFPRQTQVLAIHWHPEFVPFNLVSKRIAAMFPHMEDELVIPTQHNDLLVYGPYAGVEVDCYSQSFNQKVQLLLHFPEERVREATVLRAMLRHTFRYRSTQLFEYMDAITRPNEEIILSAAAETGASEALVEFVRINTRKVETLLADHYNEVPESGIKNKLLRTFFNGLRTDYGDAWINRTLIYLQDVKRRVKARFSLQYFYRTREVIEEARSLGGRVVIPHPEQFWPILLADYDVDGYEVWNPQSRRYTEFLIDVVNRKNKQAGRADKRLLILMGDDCHLSEKTLPPDRQDPAKIEREVGLQPAWEDLVIRKKLMQAGLDRRAVIKEYKARLSGQATLF